MLLQFTNFAATTLASGISAGATSLVLTAGTGSLFPSPTSPAYFLGVLVDSATGLTKEVVTVTARSTDTLTVTRGAEGTTPAAFIAGDRFELRLTAATMNSLESQSYTTTATAAGTTTLTVQSATNQVFTGATTQTLVLPVTSTLPYLGAAFNVFNASSGAVTVQSSGGNTIVIVGPGTAARFICILLSGTGTASWMYEYRGAITASGKVLTVSNTVTLTGTDAASYNLNEILGAATWSGSKTFGENTALILDAALSADGTYCGIVEAGTAGAALAFGELCYFQTSDSRWELARAAAADLATASLRLGICVLAAAGDGSATTMLLLGKIRADAKFPTMTIGAPVYISAATAGVITSTAPTGTTDFTVRKVGFANTADELYFNPSNDYVTLA